VPVKLASLPCPLQRCSAGSISDGSGSSSSYRWCGSHFVQYDSTMFARSLFKVLMAAPRALRLVRPATATTMTPSTVRPSAMVQEAMRGGESKTTRSYSLVACSRIMASPEPMRSAARRDGGPTGRMSNVGSSGGARVHRAKALRSQHIREAHRSGYVKAAVDTGAAQVSID